MIFWECCSSYCKGTTVKYSRYGRTGPDRPPQPTTQRILPQLGRGWRVGEPRKCYARAWTGGRDTSFYLVTVHHGQKMQFFVKELTVDHCRAPNDRSGLLRRPPRPVRTPCEPSFPSDLRIFRTEIQPLSSTYTGWGEKKYSISLHYKIFAHPDTSPSINRRRRNFLLLSK